MKMHQLLRDERGVGLVNAMLALSLLAVFALVAASLAINEKRTAYNDVVHTNAFLSADSGGEEAIAWLRSQDRAPFLINPDAGDYLVRTTTDRQMDLSGAHQEFDYAIRTRSMPLDGLPAQRPRGGYQLGDQGGYVDLFYIINSQGESGTDGESQVSLLVSKLLTSGYQ